jgi:hypothetical protein
MARISLLDKTTDENLESLCALLDNLYAYRIIQEHSLEEIEEILFALHGPDDASYEDSEETSISSLYDICEDKIIYIQDLRNVIRYVINHTNFDLSDAIFEIVDLRDI